MNIDFVGSEIFEVYFKNYKNYKLFNLMDHLYISYINNINKKLIHKNSSIVKNNFFYIEGIFEIQTNDSSSLFIMSKLNNIEIINNFDDDELSIYEIIDDIYIFKFNTNQVIKLNGLFFIYNIDRENIHITFNLFKYGYIIEN